MKLKILLLIAMLPIAACTTAPSNYTPPTVDKIIQPAVKHYTTDQYLNAANEHDRLCLRDKTGVINAPAICKLVDDYGKMRDQSRVASGKKVDVNR